VSASTQADFCATLVDEWVRGGVRFAVVAPGSRSTPLALALVADGRVDVQVHHDERCAAFMALGVGVATGRPAVLLCTSGTAATHFHAAVVEAHHAGVPLVVCTADRPPELRDVGAPQAIDQQRLYGTAVRWFYDPGPPDEAMRPAWRSIAARSVIEAADGPVHLNLPFREPLVGEPGDLPAGRANGQPWHERPGGPTGNEGEGRATGGSALVGRALVVGGSFDDRHPTLLTGLHRTSGPATVAHADALLRIPELRDELRPDVIVRSSRQPASRVVNEWLVATGADEWVVGPGWTDPSHSARRFADGTHPVLGDPDPDYVARWRALDAAADAAIAAVLADHPEPTEPATARALAASTTVAHLVVASSMPIRDVEWYGRPRSGVTVHANRGANGIDGVLSTAIGVALGSGAPTTCLIGDVALLHDSSALIGLAARDVDLTVVVVDNDGGGIFSFLPQATRPGGAAFEALFGTPHGTDIPALARAHGVEVTHVRTDRAANVAAHRRLNQAIAAAARAALP
jgi:2-succinyl-5-enolpyruvyl-6-hydroxy-3-cyclohexene-1-carboxylate synthase